MKTKLHSLLIVLACLTGIHQAAAQGTAFTYQGRLNTNGSPATGNFDFQFNLFADLGGTQPVGGAFSTNNIPVSGGLFTTTLDFGAGVFTGSNYFLQISVRTNTGGTGTFTALTPLQAVTPTPYAIMANSASNLLGKLATAQLNGTVGNAQLANNSITVNPGTGLSGGGAVALGGTTTLNNTGVLSVTGGSSDITANTVGGVATLGSDATSAATANTLVKRDASGNFSAGTITANLTGNATLASNVVSGITITNAVITNAFITNSTFAGNGGGLTNLNSAQLTSIGNNNGGGANSFIGASGNSATSGIYNTGSGYVALTSDTSGSYNSATGAGAMEDNTTGSDNIAVGYSALLLNTSGNNNTALGQSALFENHSGNNNTAIGGEALTSLGDNLAGGSNNIALGFNAGSALIANESSNIDIGSAGVANENNVIRIGTSQTQAYIAGMINGNGGGLTNLDASQLMSVGNTNIRSGGNFFIGPAGNAAITGNENTAIGVNALQAGGNANHNTAIGFNALTVNTSGGDNTANGAGALLANTTGSFNTAIGSGSLDINTTGSFSTAIGDEALLNSTSGSNNIALGYRAGFNITTGSSNIDIDNLGVSGDSNTIRIGTSQTQTFIAGTNFFSKPVGIVSTAPEGLLEIQGGADNTGANDQKDISLAYHSGGYRHWIRSRHNTAPVDNAIDFFVNNSSSSTASSAPGTGNVLVMTLNGGNVGIANAEPTHLLVVSSNGSPAYCDGTTWQNGSDKNSKEAFTAINPGAVLEKVSALPITEWKYKTEADGTKHIGPMAQDFHAAFGLNGGDDKHIATIDEEGVALAAIQALNQKLESEAKEKNARIQTLEQENGSLAGRLNELEAAVKRLAARK